MFVPCNDAAQRLKPHVTFHYLWGRKIHSLDGHRRPPDLQTSLAFELPDSKGGARFHGHVWGLRMDGVLYRRREAGTLDPILLSITMFPID